MPYQPKYLILHDYGQTPAGWKPGTDLGHNPYHALVHGGRVQYRDPKNPYAAPAPHAYKLNPQSIGLSWAGPVGGTPDKADLAAIKAEVARIKQQFPGIQIMSHGEAYARRGSMPQASKLGRGLDEASWRKMIREALNGDLQPGLAGTAGSAGAQGVVAAAGPASTPTQSQGVNGAGPVRGPANAAMANALMGNQTRDPVIAQLLKDWTYGAA